MGQTDIALGESQKESVRSLWMWTLGGSEVGLRTYQNLVLLFTFVCLCWKWHQIFTETNILLYLSRNDTFALFKMKRKVIFSYSILVLYDEDVLNLETVKDSKSSIFGIGPNPNFFLCFTSHLPPLRYSGIYTFVKSLWFSLILTWSH